MAAPKTSSLEGPEVLRRMKGCRFKLAPPRPQWKLWQNQSVLAGKYKKAAIAAYWEECKPAAGRQDVSAQEGVRFLGLGALFCPT